jgi:pyoverdine/dityrosine biosynthesis protein Dit1
MNMAQTYLSKILTTCSQYSLTEADNALLATEGIEAYIYRKITSKKFRKWAVDASAEQQIKQAIHRNVTMNKPISFTFPFGGYKLWSLPTSPEVDWAEFFSIAYYLQWVAPIAATYQPGVHFLFSSDDVVVERLDNIPPDDTKAYFASFQKLITAFTPHLPKNIHLEIKRIGDLYTKDEFDRELDKQIPLMKKMYETPDPERYKAMLKTSVLNYQWNGVKDLTKLTDKEKESFVALGPIIHDAYGKLEKRRAFIRAADTIVTFCMPIPDAIALGTTRTSIAKFWMGQGILEKREDSFIERILTPNQITTLTTVQHETEAINLIALHNFKTIDCYPPLDFTSNKSAT